ncbi:hypothetical protein Dd1591_0573 [Dickeya chrysanthemi Ech1591]|uniref:Uncharacterized protein n=1 Tax=Dickeya chrysanthemi (strain Ech1591) TaxID=561229 RepID=C6CJT5_DICC1|nr:hypothetical protein [Dickeya chrysanthemi]ACT05455.1 hypothetical protein Dd1591_0573 [Dickeya chrysanthemi Ech1591]
MKKAIYTSVLITLLASIPSYASVNLIKSDDETLSSEIIKSGNDKEIIDISIQDNQQFDIIDDGKYIGTIIPARGFYNNDKPLCFIGWSTDKKTISKIIPSIGQGYFELSLCSKLDAIGKIEEKGRTFIGFVYTVGLRDRYAQNYFLIELDKEKRTIEDKSQLIEKLQNNSDKKNIADLKNDIKKIEEK